MRTCGLFLALAVGLTVVSFTWADGTSAAKADPARIDKLIENLASPKFAERSRARQQLKAIGEPALEALRKATRSEDVETSRIAGELVKGLETKLLTANLLAPKRVRLELNDTPVREAVAELARQSGYAITVLGDESALAKRRVTLQTGETTFWEAFDQLCQKGGLVELQGQGTGRVPVRLQPVPGVPVQPLPGGVLPVVPPGNPQPPQAFGAAAQPAQPAPPAPVAAQIQIQINPQGGQPVPLPAVAPLGVRPNLPVAPNRQLVVQPGTPVQVPTCYAGAVRIRALPGQAAGTPAGEVWLRLEATPEPRLEGFSVEQNVNVDKAVDDQGQELKVVTEPPPAVNVPPGVRPNIAVARWPLARMGRSEVLLRLKAGDKEAGALKELAGTLTVNVLMPTEPLVKVDNVLKAAGQKVNGKDGGSLELLSIAKEANGDYKLQVRMSGLGASPFNGVILNGGGAIQVQVQGGGMFVAGGVPTGKDTPALLDGQGKAYLLTQIPSRSLRGVNGTFTTEMTLLYRANNGQGEPASLVLNGQRSVALGVPFRFENVPLQAKN